MVLESRAARSVKGVDIHAEEISQKGEKKLKRKNKNKKKIGEARMSYSWLRDFQRERTEKITGSKQRKKTLKNFPVPDITPTHTKTHHNEIILESELEKILKAFREECHKGSGNSMELDFSTTTAEARKQLTNIFRIVRERFYTQSNYPSGCG